MLDYEWGNPSSIMLSGDNEPEPEPEPARHIMDHYTHDQTPFSSANNTHLLLHQPANPNLGFHHFNNPQQQTHVSPLLDPRAYGGASSSYAAHQMLTLDPSGGIFVVPKSEELSQPLDFTARLGLNLGGRTYFSSAEDEFVSRLYRRSRALDSGSGNTPKCQAEGCNADLSHAKHYHRRHKVCEYHSKAATVIAAGLTQRFCQQCSRFHPLSEFDNGKRSCRKRLADHNRRRRKSQQPNNQDNHKPQLENTRNSSSDNLPRSPPDSGVQSSSSVTVAVSPPRISLDYFRQKPYQGTTVSSTSASTVFFPSG